MFVRVTVSNGSSVVGLEDLDNFRQFHIVAEQLDHAEVATAIRAANAGEYKDGYVWIRRRFIEDHAPAVPADWSTQFAGMVAYAAKQGWVSSDGRFIRAHIQS